MKKMLLILGFMLIVTNAYATGGVQSENTGNQGDIFVATGENHGHDSRGIWTDPSFLKGQDGATGQQGEQGIAGKDGLNGLDGRDGLNGSDGQKGDAGLQGEQGQAGVDGENGKTPIKGVDYNDGVNGQDGLNGKDVDPATVEKLEKSIQQNTNATNNLNTRVNKLEETQNIIGGVLRIKDTKKWSVDLFIDYSTNRQMIDRQGIRFTYKMGESYQDKENKRLEARIQALENK